jgi:hypothetical protein
VVAEKNVGITERFLTTAIKPRYFAVGPQNLKLPLYIGIFSKYLSYEAAFFFRFFQFGDEKNIVWHQLIYNPKSCKKICRTELWWI